MYIYIYIFFFDETLRQHYCELFRPLDKTSSEEKEAVISKLQMELTLLRATTGSTAAPGPETRKQTTLNCTSLNSLAGLEFVCSVGPCWVCEGPRHGRAWQGLRGSGGADNKHKGLKRELKTLSPKPLKL